MSKKEKFPVRVYCYVTEKEAAKLEADAIHANMTDDQYRRFRLGLDKRKEPKKPKSIPRAFSVVKYVGIKVPKESILAGDLVYLGEVPNMPGHAAVTSLVKGQTVIVHTENLKELNPEDV